MNVRRRDGDVRDYPVKAAILLPHGRPVFVESTGYATNTSASGANKFVGIARLRADNTGGANGDISVEVFNDGEFELTGSGFAQTDVRAPVYLADNGDGLTKSASSATYIGRISKFVSSTIVAVEIETMTATPTATTSPVASSPIAAQQALSGAGAVNLTSLLTVVTTTSTNALTLADGTVVGQTKEILMTVDGGDGTLTPTSLAGGTTITFSNVGDYVMLQWDGTEWVVVKRYNQATGAITTPVVA